MKVEYCWYDLVSGKGDGLGTCVHLVGHRCWKWLKMLAVIQKFKESWSNEEDDFYWPLYFLTTELAKLKLDLNFPRKVALQ